MVTDKETESKQSKNIRIKVLFITPSSPDYLADSLLHGLRSFIGDHVVDYPRCDILYQEVELKQKSQIYGRGFTLYGLLEDVFIDRLNIYQKVDEGFFDLIIFPNIFSYFGAFLEFLPHLNFRNTIILDSADSPQLYPFAGKWYRNPSYWFLPRAHSRFLYFKREWTPDSIRSLWFQVPPPGLAKYLPVPNNLRPISFSIPVDKIVSDTSVKTKLFPKHIVDCEVAENVSGSVTSYAFASEAEYYADLQASKFGITTKRSGWDCLRHYEIAANGAVPCFRDLDKKPITCAPHGLNEQNSISYRNYNDLMQKIQNISDSEYENLQKNALMWARENTTLARAKQVLDTFEKFKRQNEDKRSRLFQK